MSKHKRWIKHQQQALVAVKKLTSAPTPLAKKQYEESTRRTARAITRKAFSNPTTDIAWGAMKAIGLSCVGILLFNFDFIAEAFSVFAIAYCLFFYKLCTAGTTPVATIPYTTGAAWLASHKQSNRQLPKRLKHPRYVSTSSAQIAAINCDTYISSNGSHDDERQFTSALPITHDINPASGLPMVGAVDIAGNAYGINDSADSLSLDTTDSSTTGFCDTDMMESSIDVWSNDNDDML
jgi:hypothetical protein